MGRPITGDTLAHVLVELTPWHRDATPLRLVEVDPPQGFRAYCHIDPRMVTTEARHRSWLVDAVRFANQAHDDGYRIGYRNAVCDRENGEIFDEEPRDSFDIWLADYPHMPAQPARTPDKEQG